MTTAVIFGKSNCVWCDRAKRLLDGLGISYEYKDCGIFEVKEALFNLLPAVKTVPQIWLNGVYVGGYDALVTFLETAKKNQEAADWNSGNYGQGRL